MRERSMKLKNEFVTYTTDEVQFLVPLKSDAFSGIVRSNETAAFIVDCLKKETTEEKIVENMLAEYDAPRDVIVSDVRGILKKLRSISALEE